MTTLESPSNGRFIPARAGNTRSPISTNALRPVHPRPRGEHWPIIGHILVKYGSSPPARGTLPDLLDAEHDLRFIPARAGNTSTPR